MSASGDLVTRAGAGDPEALGALWRAWQPRLLRFLRGTGVAEPADVATEVWLSVARSLPTFGGTDEEFPRWLFTIARRRAVDAHRRDRRRPGVSPGSDPREGEREGKVAASGTVPAPDDVVGTTWAVEMVGRLPPEQAEVILLRVLVGLSVADVAEITGRSPGAVRVAAHRGLRRLREMVGSRGGEPPPGEPAGPRSPAVGHRRHPGTCEGARTPW